MGDIFRVLFKTADDATKSLILKMAPTNKDRREKMGVRDMFLREISMYDEVKFNLGCNCSKSYEKRKCFYPS